VRQVLHIFKKDVRHLRWEIALLLALVAAVVASGVRGTHSLQLGPAPEGGLLSVLMVAAWALITVRLIHSEALAGDRQFWITRPYEWKSLLAAKILFLLVFVTLPMLLSDAVIVRAQGFHVIDYLPGLLCEQALRWMLVIAPLAALAALTSRFSAFVFSVLVVVALLATPLLLRTPFDEVFALGLELNSSPWDNLINLFGGLAGAGCLAIIVWQYASRKTGPARVALSCVLLLGLAPLLPDRTAFELQHWFSGSRGENSAVTVELGLAPQRSSLQRESSVTLPFFVSGVPQDLEARLDGSFVRVLDSKGASDWLEGELEDPTPRDGLETAANFVVPRGVLDTIVLRRPVRIEAVVWLTLYRASAGQIPESLLDPDDNLRPSSRRGAVPDFSIPSVGICDADAGQRLFLVCRTPLRGPSVRLIGSGRPILTRELYAPSYSPLPAELNITPLTWLPGEPQFTVQKPVFHLRREFHSNPVQLEKYYNSAPPPPKPPGIMDGFKKLEYLNETKKGK
jgi:hypothetical protein